MTLKKPANDRPEATTLVAMFMVRAVIGGLAGVGVWVLLLQFVAVDARWPVLVIPGCALLAVVFGNAFYKVAKWVLLLFP